MVRLPVGRWKGGAAANSGSDITGRDVFITVPDNSREAVDKVDYFDEDGELAGTNHMVRNYRDLNLGKDIEPGTTERAPAPGPDGFIHDEAPVISSAGYAGMEARQYDYNRNGRQGTILEGREFLSSVELGYASGEQAASPVGQRLLVLPISPVSIGGRPSAFAQLYQVNELERLSITYVPTVPTSKGGSIAMYYHADDSIPLADVGDAALRRASQHDSFVDTPSWVGVRMHIDPIKAVRKYFDQETNTVRLSVAGLIALITGNAIPADSSGTTPLGSVFVDYAFRFEDPAISSTIQTTKTGLCNMTAQTGAVTQYDAVMGKFLGTANSGAVSFPLCTGDRKSVV